MCKWLLCWFGDQYKRKTHDLLKKKKGLKCLMSWNVETFGGTQCTGEDQSSVVG